MNMRKTKIICTLDARRLYRLRLRRRGPLLGGAPVSGPADRLKKL